MLDSLANMASNAPTYWPHPASAYTRKGKGGEFTRERRGATRAATHFHAFAGQEGFLLGRRGALHLLNQPRHLAGDQ
jgi:hypothetical protein